MTNNTNLHLPIIEPTTDLALEARLRHKIDHKTKPLGALGRLEDLALQLGLIQRQETVSLRDPQMVVFAADHGIAAEGVSAYPQAVTVQMVGNMLAGGAAINVFARQHGFALQVVDAGVASDLPAHPQLLQRKIAHGTKNLCLEPAMSQAEARAALQTGREIVQALPGNVLALGEMGIANTSAAALLLTRLTGASIADATGRGTGLNDRQLLRKQDVLARALARHTMTQPLDAMQELAA
ncbi:MAG: nicotinate-nucleotide--dimethylbenzimidazole phosphoribosyltransferase, partial [Polaromonas sp.]